MTLHSLAKKLRTALLGTIFGLAGLGLTSSDGCTEALDAAATGFAIGQSLGYGYGDYDDGGDWWSPSYSAGDHYSNPYLGTAVVNDGNGNGYIALGDGTFY